MARPFLTMLACDQNFDAVVRALPIDVKQA
jgi:hypothetical protein